MLLRKNLLILSLFIFICSFSYAAQKQEFGYVNVVDVMMLHPTMQYFDLSSKRFSLKAFKGINVEERIEQNKVKARKEINKLKENLKVFEDKIKEIEATYQERREHLLKPGERIELMTPTRRDIYDEKMAKLESQYETELHNINTEIYPLKNKIKKLEDSSAYTGYSTEKETRELFSLMLDDVFDAINVISKRKNTSFVFNSSACIEYLDSPSDIYVQTPNNLSCLFDESYKKEVEERGESEANIAIGSSITQWLNSKAHVFKYNIDRRLSMFVLNGGINMTLDVIDYIYEKHKIDKQQREFIKDYFNKIMLPGSEGHRDF